MAKIHEGCNPYPSSSYTFAFASAVVLNAECGTPCDKISPTPLPVGVRCGVCVKIWSLICFVGAAVAFCLYGGLWNPLRVGKAVWNHTTNLCPTGHLVAHPDVVPTHTVPNCQPPKASLTPSPLLANPNFGVGRRHLLASTFDTEPPPNYTASTNFACLPSFPKYLLVTNSVEGLGGWLRSLAEWILISREFKITIVEPCVANGSVVPCCTPCPVLVSDANRQDWRFVAQTGDPLPLSAYIDLRHLAKTSGAKVVPYARWRREWLELPAPVRTLDLRHWWVKPANSSVMGLDPAILEAACQAPLQAFGADYNAARIMDNLRMVMKKAWGHTMIITNVFRYKKHKRHPGLIHFRLESIRFAQPHRQAVDQFIQAHLTTNFAALQWRAGITQVRQMPMCLGKVLQWARYLNGTGRRVLLLTDLPSQSTAYHPTWDLQDFVDGSEAWRSEIQPKVDAALALQAQGVVRYADMLPPTVDRGSVAIRELLLGLTARCLLLCSAPECSDCTRPESKYTEELQQRREHMKQSFATTWMSEPREAGCGRAPKAPQAYPKKKGKRGKGHP
mmetsp:Transcript_29708/g.53336  ORF Transcript_29708/g.53336 Transcript_29708/m.53336 type:complete len:561 (-) Transcript_29708:55-1737(-)